MDDEGISDKDEEVVRELEVVDLVPVPVLVSVSLVVELRRPVDSPVGIPSLLVVLRLLVFPPIVRSSSTKGSPTGMVVLEIVAVVRLVVGISWSSVSGNVSCEGRIGIGSSNWSASERSILTGRGGY
jgi:hypothetical protein